MRRVAIFGITSAIAEATARLFAARGDALFVVGRNCAMVDAIANDLRTRGASKVETACADLAATEAHERLFDAGSAALGGLDVVLIAHGVLPDQQACEASYQAFLDQFQVNALSTISLITVAANRFEAKRRGTIAVLSSVAGDRGRPTNFAYGTAKAAVSTFLDGQRARLYRSGVHVVTVKPGFVDTPMTAHLPKGRLWAQPEAVARATVLAIDHGKNNVYTPWFWRVIMFVIRHIPEPIFKRLAL